MSTNERYTSERIRTSVDTERDRLFASWSIGRPANWTTDQRTKDLICIGNWLDEELARLQASEADRRTQNDYYHRWSRSEEDLWSLAAEVLNTVLDGKVVQNRTPHRRWG